MAVLLVTATLTVMASAIIVPSLPGPEAEFSDVAHADLLVRLRLTLPALFIAMAAPLLGMLVDRVGRRDVLVFSLALYGLAGGSGLVLSNLYAILAGRALLGIAVGEVFVASTALIADWFSGPDRARTLGLQAASMGIGGAVFLALGGFLTSISPRGPFVVHVVALVVPPFAARVTTEPVRERVDPSAGAGRARMPWALVSLVLAVALFGMLALSIVPTRLPSYLAGLTGAGPLTSGLAIALLNVVGVAVSLNFRRVRERLSFPVIVVAVFVAIGAGLLLLTLSGWIAHGTPAALRGRAGRAVHGGLPGAAPLAPGQPARGAGLQRGLGVRARGGAVRRGRRRRRGAGRRSPARGPGARRRLIRADRPLSATHPPPQNAAPAPSPRLTVVLAQHPARHQPLAAKCCVRPTAGSAAGRIAASAP